MYIEYGHKYAISFHNISNILAISVHVSMTNMRDKYRKKLILINLKLFKFLYM